MSCHAVTCNCRNHFTATLRFTHDDLRHVYSSLCLRKQLHFRTPSQVFPRMKSEQQAQKFHTVLITCHYLDLGSASDWLYQISFMAWPIRSTTQIWGNDMLFVWNSCAYSGAKMSFCRETSGTIIAKMLAFFYGKQARL